MDYFLKEKNYKNATQVAIEVMLQEHNDNQLTLGLSLLSCLNYLKTLDKVKNIELPKEEPPGEDDKVVCILQSKCFMQKSFRLFGLLKEKILVDFKRNPFFDDHFDIRNFLHLIGKSLYFSSSNLNFDSTLLNTTKVSGFNSE
jgi:small subunit ribosomal protein S27